MKAASKCCKLPWKTTEEEVEEAAKRLAAAKEKMDVEAGAVLSRLDGILGIKRPLLDGEDGCTSLTTDVGKSLNTAVHFGNEKSNWSSFIMIDRSFFQSPSTYF